MSNLSKSLQEKLLGQNFAAPLSLEQRLHSKKDKGTEKRLYKTVDGHFTESVLMPNTLGKHTLCLSSQIGCIFACDFCATGKMGFKRDLSLAEILYQYVDAAKDLDISNIVFMGMGEAFLNPSLNEVLDRLISKDYFDFAARSITVSTIGIPEKIVAMAEQKQIKLAWSYHSSFEEKREKLFPVLSKKYSVKQISNAFLDYLNATHKRITIEYLLLKDFNDGKEEAKSLIALSKKLFFHLNIIIYNPHPYSSYEKPDKSSISKFLSNFEDSDIEVTVRMSKGEDIQGACGQLAGAQQDF